MRGIDCSTQSNTTPSSVFFDPAEAFEFVSDEEPDPCSFSDVEGEDDGGVPIKTRISPRDCPLAETESCGFSSGKGKQGGDGQEIVAPVEGFQGMSGVQKFRQRIETVNEITSAKISTETFPEIPQHQVPRKNSKWRRSLLGCLGGCPVMAAPSENGASDSEMDSETNTSQSHSSSTRGSTGLGWLVKKFVDYRWRNVKMDLDKIAGPWQYEDPAKIVDKSWKGLVGPKRGQKFPLPRFPRPKDQTPTTRPSPCGNYANPNPRRLVGDTSARDSHGKGMCDTWDGIMHTRAVGRSNTLPGKPHIGESRQRRRLDIYQTWHGDSLEATSPVQRRNADIMMSLNQINMGRRSGEGKAIFETATSDLHHHHMDEECQDSLHLQVPLTPASIFSDSEEEEYMPPAVMLATDASLGAIPEDTSRIQPIDSMGSRDIGSSLEKYRGDRLMPQDPMLSQKLLFDTLFETCQSFDTKEDASVGVMESTTPDPEGSSSDSGYQCDECTRLSGIWGRDVNASDKAEVVCDPTVLSWLFKKSGKHSNHLKIEVHEECIAVTGQILGGFDRTEILSRSAKGRKAPRCDGRPGNMKVWIENIPNGFRERNSWEDPQAGAKMDEYELSSDGQTLVLTTHITFKLGRNCRLRTTFRRLGEPCDHPFKN
ncbi:hypothetical protein BSKO_07630 [Bryopsis sp. KO-2023]|nr:hypothetical protein BSKO_07630 [Bryopsis sp. KO-2023]